MKRSELTEFAVEEEGFKLKICRATNGSLTTMGGASSHGSPVSEAGPVPTGASRAGTVAPNSGTTAEEPGLTYIKSPMVGTFYRASSPENKPFVDTDSKVIDSTVVCIIEAMKIMNEIQSETKGTIVEILAENGQPVEYGQRLFKVRI